MSDEKLRELERRFRETGSAEDEVAWLRTRARSGEKLDWESYSRLHELDVDAAADYLRWRVAVGDVTQARADLAAYCGLLGPAPGQIDLGALSADPDSSWLLFLAALAAGFSHPGWPSGQTMAPLIEAGLRWLSDPTDQNSRACLATSPILLPRHEPLKSLRLLMFHTAQEDWGEDLPDLASLGRALLSDSFCRRRLQAAGQVQRRLLDPSPVRRGIG